MLLSGHWLHLLISKKFIIVLTSNHCLLKTQSCHYSYCLALLRHDYSYAQSLRCLKLIVRVKHHELLDKTRSIIKGIPNPLIRGLSLKEAATLASKVGTLHTRVICASSWRPCLCLYGLSRDCFVFQKLQDFGVRGQRRISSQACSYWRGCTSSHSEVQRSLEATYCKAYCVP